MIPDGISREHVIAALREIDTSSVPWHRTSAKYDLLHEGRKYPPKYVISVAARIATGRELPPNKFHAGEETNSFLLERGFQIVDKATQGLHDSLEFVLQRYQEARTTPFGTKNEVRDAFDKIQQVVEESVLPPNFKVSWSAGKGNWATIPWVAVFDLRETHTTQEGIYCVFLFRDDCSGVYLTLNQGVTAVMEQFKGAAAVAELKKRAETLRKSVQTLSQQGFKLDNGIDLRTTSKLGVTYQHATVAYKLYERGSVPPDPLLIQDLQALISAYRKLVDEEQPSKRTLAAIATRADESTSQRESIQFNRAAALKELIGAIGASGFIFEPWQVATFVTALRTKPFAILAGISGTGKSKLPALVHEHTGGESRLIPVRPDWTDSSDVLGYIDLQGTFRPGSLLAVAKEAVDTPDKHFLCVLDEMNLARVEQYFAEVLSKIEDRHPIEATGYETDPLLSSFGGNVPEQWAAVNFPRNLALVGTVNMDESAHGFSRKVLDRAFTLELSDVDLSIWGSNELTSAVPKDAVEPWPVNAWLPKAISLATFTEDLGDDEKAEIQTAIGALIELNKYLVHAQLQLGYRARDEIALFVLHAADVADSFVTRTGEPVSSLDIAIQMKVLPRLIGGSAALQRVIMNLLGWSRSGVPVSDESDAAALFDEWEDAGRPAAPSTSKFPRTFAKLCLMWERLRNDGYTSFWL